LEGIGQAATALHATSRGRTCVTWRGVLQLTFQFHFWHV